MYVVTCCVRRIEKTIRSIRKLRVHAASFLWMKTQKESRHLEIVEAFRSLDDPPRLPLFLSLYEGYTAPEIAEIVDAPVNTVYSWIARGKKMLKEALS